MALAADQADTFPKVAVDDIDFLSKRIIDVPKLLSEKYVLLWRLDTIGIVAVLLITFFLPSSTLPASAK